MDTAATILAGLIILSAPFSIWFGLKARARRKRETAEIRASLEERSRGLSELSSRLDALEEEGCRDRGGERQGASGASGDGGPLAAAGPFRRRPLPVPPKTSLLAGLSGILLAVSLGSVLGAYLISVPAPVLIGLLLAVFFQLVSQAALALCAWVRHRYATLDAGEPVLVQMRRSARGLYVRGWLAFFCGLLALVIGWLGVVILP